MHKVKKIKQKDVVVIQQAITTWQTWKEKYPEDILKQFVADITILACKRQISIKQLYTTVANKEGVFEASQRWHDIPRLL